MFDERLEEFVCNRILDNTVSILKEIISCLDRAREQGALCNFCSVDPDSDHVDTCPTKVPLWRCSVRGSSSQENAALSSFEFSRRN